MEARPGGCGARHCRCVNRPARRPACVCATFPRRSSWPRASCTSPTSATRCATSLWNVSATLMRGHNALGQWIDRSRARTRHRFQPSPLRRAFHLRVGIAPKAAARVFRFEHACRLFLTRPAALSTSRSPVASTIKPTWCTSGIRWPAARRRNGSSASSRFYKIMKSLEVMIDACRSSLASV